MNKIKMFICVLCTIFTCFSTVSVQAYTESDVMLLARIINAEAGEGCQIEHNQLVGCVVMNRVNDPRFPNTIKGVVYQRGQYTCVNSKKFNQYPPQISIDAARYVLSGKAYCPKNVVYQSESVQGKIYKKFYVNTGWYSSTTYFCYG
jgi:hypothetical protein